MPVTIVLLVGLFSVQRIGTGSVGSIFGWVMLLWFTTLAVLGLSHIWPRRKCSAPSTRFTAGNFSPRTAWPVFINSVPCSSC
jgi:KUP system potassium uptake protein